MVLANRLQGASSRQDLLAENEKWLAIFENVQQISKGWTKAARTRLPSHSKGYFDRSAPQVFPLWVIFDRAFGLYLPFDVRSAPNATGAEARLTGRDCACFDGSERAPPITRPGDDGIVPVICPTRQMIS